MKIVKVITSFAERMYESIVHSQKRLCLIVGFLLICNALTIAFVANDPDQTPVIPTSEDSQSEEIMIDDDCSNYIPWEIPLKPT